MFSKSSKILEQKAKPELEPRQSNSRGHVLNHSSPLVDAPWLIKYILEGVEVNDFYGKK